MSFILDALKKSETERQQQGSSEFASVPSGDDEPRAPRWLWVLGGLLAINLAVLLGVLLRDDVPAATPVAAAPVNGAAVAAGSAAATQPMQDAAPSFAERLEKARELRPAPAPRVAATTPAATPIPDTEPVATAVVAPEPGPGLRALPTADELIANGTIRLPELHLDIHVYSDAPADRFVFINMVRHREGSRLAEGPLVREITPEGVILDYSGTEFLLPRE